MEFTYRYHSQSQVNNSSHHTQVTFSPDSLRPPTFFVGELKQKIAFREAISALHQVVVSDMRFTPKDKTAYQQWLAQEEEHLLAQFIAKKSQAQEEVNTVQAELKALNRENSALMGPYDKAQNQYFKHLYQHDKDAWFVLDPVITVHPDEVFFECFSEDESSYGKLSCSYNVFEHISETACGTTNIDYSEGLYHEFQKIRDYRQTRLAIDPDGFKVQTTGEQAFEETKIDLPASWVRGFLQVSSAMTLPMVTLQLQPMDIHNICFKLRRKKERTGPRAMRFELTPGLPATVTFEPWGDKMVLPRSIYQGAEARSIRVWGRRRLHILERLIPIAKHFTLQLMGDGLPSFYIADLGDMSFTLGLSGWSANDWSTMGNFDLLAPRVQVDELTLQRVYQALQQTWSESSRALAQRLQLDETQVKAALAVYSQHGQVLYDLAGDVYRIRELSRNPLPIDDLRFVNERDAKAARFVSSNLVTLNTQNNEGGVLNLRGAVMDNAKAYNVILIIDQEQRIREGRCECHFYHANQLRQGPCEHLLALRKAHSLQALGIA